MTLTENDRIAAKAIVANIADLEAARHFLIDRMDPWLVKEMTDLLKKKADAFGWKISIDIEGDDYWAMPQDWATPNSRRDRYEEDAWFGLGRHDGEGENEGESWVAQVTGKAPSGTWIELCFCQEPIKKTVWRKILLEHPDVIQELRTMGFVIEMRDGWIDYPVRLDPEALARAFEADDFSEASAPFELAIDMAEKAKPLFDTLVAAIRERI